MAPIRTCGFVDPGWEHGVAQDEKKKKVKCNYCGKIVSGGIYRLKQHLARVSGEVTYCDKAPEEVYLRMRENLEGCRSNKKPRQSEDDEQSYLNFHSNDDEDGGLHVAYRNRGRQLMVSRNVGSNMTPLRSLRYVDPGWEHGVAQDERKKKVKCNYCEKIVSGGINRFKQHLARIPGEVAPCKHAPEEVYLKIKENMKWHRTGRRNGQTDANELSAYFMQSDNEEEEDEKEESLHHISKERLIDGDKRSSKDLRSTFRGMSPGGGSEPSVKRSRLDSVFLKTTKRPTEQLHKQALVKRGANRRSRKEVMSAICKFFCYAGIPFQSANSVYFHKMLETVGQYGSGLVGPSCQLISGRLLQDEVATIKTYLVELKASWAITGCSILVDSRKDSDGRTSINFLVSCPRGVYFVSSVNATEVADDPSNLFRVLDAVVDEIGEENVVQVITENTPNYKAAGKMLEEKRRNLFWTPCATYCIDHMLEDFLKLRSVEDCMEKCQKITKFIYNRNWLLNFMKNEFTQGLELLRPAVTRNASNFATLQCLLDHRASLRRMFVSNEWTSCRFSKSGEGQEVEMIVLNTSFWKKVQYVCKSVEPVLQVLQKSDSVQSLSMSSIYNDMYRAKFAIQSIHGDDARKYGPFWNVIDSNWNSLFCHPLHMAAFFLNPSYRYRPDFVAHSEVVRGLNECIVRLESDSSRRISASMQISDYNSAKSDFGTELAISTRTELDPAAWWQQHGISCLELQQIAVRILSQTCSSLCCEHYWSPFKNERSQKNNALSQRKMADLLYVHYNLRLRERQLRKRSSDSVSLDDILMEHLLDDWIVEPQKQGMQEDEEILCPGMETLDAYENDLIDYEDGTTEAARKGCLQLVCLTNVEPLDVNPANGGASTDNDADVKFYDDELSD